MSETTPPRPGPELVPPAAPHRAPPFSQHRLQYVHADVSLSAPTREIALTLLRLPSGRREAEYAQARRGSTTVAEVQVALGDAARMHELDQIYPVPEAEQPGGELAGDSIRSSWWRGQPVEVRLYGGEDRWSAARLDDIEDGRGLVVHLDDGARQLVELADLRPAPLPYLTIPDGARP